MIQFKELRLSGFKSFPDKTELEIGIGLNGIVGPNGCGKSNLVEALKWVMGENSAKRMRGGEGGMEDVIFAGTEKRTGRNFAEVSVLLDNSSRSAPPAYNGNDEIEVTRRIEKDYGSQYKINGKTVRARDVQMLFADTVTGASSPALVSQGQITKIINAKPLDRRLILEESAGISGLYARRHEAELRLRAADTNLIRLNDIIGSMETRLNALKRQSRQASRYRNINAQIRQLEILIAFLDYKNLQERDENIRKLFGEKESSVAERMATVTQLTKTQTVQSADLPALRQKEAEVAATLQTQRIALQRIEDENNRHNQALQDTLARLEQTATDRQHETTTLKESTETLARLEEEEQAILNDQGNDDGKLEEKQKIMGELEEKVLALEEQYTTLMESAAEARARKQSLEQQIRQNEERLKVISARAEKAEKELAQVTATDKKIAQIKELEGEIKTLDQKSTQLDTDVGSAYVTAQQAQKKVNDERNALSAIEGKRSEFNAEVSMLESFFKEEGRNFTPVLEQVTADSGFEKALSRALGDSLLASLESDAPSAWVKRQNFNAPALPGGVKALLPYIKAPEALHLALSQIGFVANENDGDRLAQELQVGQSLVSANGTYWRWDGFRVKSSATDRHSVRLEQKNKLKELHNKRPQIEDLFAQAKKSLEKAIREQEETQQRHEKLQAELKSLQNNLMQRRAALATSREEHAKTDSEITRLKEIIQIASEDTESLKSNTEEAKELLSAHQSSASDKQAEKTEAVRQTLLEAREAHQSAVRAFDLYQQEQNSRKARLHAMADERVALQNRSIRARERLRELDERQTEFQNKLEDLKNQPKTFKDGTEKLLTRIAELEAERNEAAEALAKVENELAETNRALREAEQVLSQSREERAAAQATHAALEEQIAGMKRSINEQFDIPADELAQHLNVDPDKQRTDQLEDLRQQKEKLNRERDGIGPVNLAADDEAIQLEKEVGGILSERNDLTQAIEELRAGIQEINSEARERLIAAFEHVNGHFKELFTRLFGGGRAHLALIDDNDPLGAGLEIFAQPPGKTLQSLSLLSGGEQTLTSIALIIAMFLTNPSPICVLDEIDAPLDDANVDRVCDLLEEIAERGETRFLMITHHRLTMARMDRLYGVTMAEKGVSQLVSVDLQKSFEFMEAA